MTTKERQSPEIVVRRAKAYEAYLVQDDQGKRPTLQSVALQVGATLTAVKYWKRVDRWDDRISEAADATATGASTATQNVRALLRAGVAEHIGTLNSLIRDKRQRAQDRIKGIVEYVKLAKELDALDPTVPADPKPQTSFQDDVPLPVKETDDVYVQHDLGSLRPAAGLADPVSDTYALGGEGAGHAAVVA